jgi:heterodisulfide reductase subunit B
MMKYALFLGCTVPARARNYEASSRIVAKHFGVEFVDIGLFSCCGFPIKGVSQDATLLLAARNLALAEEQKLDICALCSACTSILTEAAHLLNHDEAERKRVNEKLAKVNREYRGTVNVKHISRILYEDIGVEKVKKAVKVDLSELKIANHYGCHYLKPTEIFEGFDDAENPHSLDELLEAAGIQVVKYRDLKECCGGAVLAVDETIPYALVDDKLTHVKEAGADAISLVCPFCSVMYDGNQKTVEKNYEKEFHIPVFYLPQLIGWALGYSAKELGMQLNVVKTKELVGRFAEKEA